MGKRVLSRMSRCKKGTRYWQRQRYEIIEALKAKYPVTLLCKLMDVCDFTPIMIPRPHCQDKPFVHIVPC